MRRPVWKECAHNVQKIQICHQHCQADFPADVPYRPADCHVASLIVLNYPVSKNIFTNDMVQDNMAQSLRLAVAIFVQPCHKDYQTALRESIKNLIISDIYKSFAGISLQFGFIFQNFAQIKLLLFFINPINNAVFWRHIGSRFIHHTPGHTMPSLCHAFRPPTY